ncbi:MAG: hypothetical protein NTV03_01585 [Candidatus Nomurabacteria bacterium]|nr:hypothetical protein [Candidatus Nomurabacteria bacterium]
MKNILSIAFLFSVLVPIHFSSALFYTPSIGSQSNPLYIQVQPNSLQSWKDAWNKINSMQYVVACSSKYDSVKSLASKNGFGDIGDPSTANSEANYLNYLYSSYQLCVNSAAQTQNPIQHTGTLCNGTYYNACPAGENFVCPSSGSAYCEIPKTNDPVKTNESALPYGCSSNQGYSATNGVSCSNTNVPITPIKKIETNQSTCTSGYSKNALDQCIENNQLCKNDFGGNTKWGGKVNNKNGPVCDCVTGYVWNKEGTTCLISQIKKLDVVTPIKIEKTQNEAKEDTPNISKVDPVILNQEVVTNTTTEVKPKSFWSKIKGLFGF